jgi:replicative DNA helicase
VAHRQVLEDRLEGLRAGIATGLPELDNILDRSKHPVILVVIGARLSMGKTAMPLTISLNAANRYSAAFLSMEVTKGELI